MSSDVARSAKAVAHVGKASIDLVGHLSLKLLFVPALLLGIGAALLAIRDVLYEFTTWSSTELVALVVAWDAWVAYSDIVDVEVSIVIAALEILSDALHYLGIHFLPTFSMGTIVHSLVGPIFSPADLNAALAEVATCESVSSGPQILSLSLKMGLNDSVCPTIRYFRPTSLRWFFDLFDGLTFGVDNNCQCDPTQYSCNRLPLCLVLNSGYMFIDLLFPVFLLGLTAYFMLGPCLILLYDIFEGALNAMTTIVNRVTSKIEYALISAIDFIFKRV